MVYLLVTQWIKKKLFLFIFGNDWRGKNKKEKIHWQWACFQKKKIQGVSVYDIMMACPFINSIVLFKKNNNNKDVWFFFLLEQN